LKPRCRNLIVWSKFTNFFCLFIKERVQACWFMGEQEEAHGVLEFLGHLHMLGFDPGKPFPLTLGNGALHGSMWTALPGNGCCFVMVFFSPLWMQCIFS
jgi:hypothetical protein